MRRAIWWWAFLIDRTIDGRAPDESRLCPLFWRCTLITPFAIVVALVILVAMSPGILATVIGHQCEKRGIKFPGGSYTPPPWTQRLYHKLCPVIRANPEASDADNSRE